MSSQAYKRITSLTALIAVIAVLAYDHLGSYSWVSLSLASLAAIIGGICYLKLHGNQEETSEVPQTAVAPSSEAAPKSSDPGSLYKVVSFSESDRQLARARHFIVHGGIDDASLDYLLRETRHLRARQIAYVLTELEKHEWDAGVATEKLKYLSLVDEISQLSRQHIAAVAAAGTRKSGLQPDKIPFGFSAKVAAKGVRHPENFRDLAIPCIR
jgi:hypothetical protein